MSHTATEQWQSFEVRMRHRRAERCRVRAEVAFKEGCYGEAAEAFAEARKLEPDAPENAAVERLLSHRPASDGSGAPPAGGASKKWIESAAALLLVGSAVGLGYWLTHRLPDTAPPATPSAVSAARPRNPEAEVHPVTTLTVARPIGSAEAPPEDVLTPAAGDEQPVAAGQPAATAGASGSPQPAAAPVASVNVLPVPDSQPEREAPVSPPVRALAEPPAIPPRAPGDEARAAAPSAAEEARIIRSVLSKYEAAYSALDASAAGEVWPGVDQRALSRAFGDLDSQRVSLGDCNVTITGVTAHAECSGTATWTPKVGGGGRTQPRSWTFDLAKQNDNWLIHSASIK